MGRGKRRERRAVIHARRGPARSGRKAGTDRMNGLDACVSRTPSRHMATHPLLNLTPYRVKKELDAYRFSSECRGQTCCSRELPPRESASISCRSPACIICVICHLKTTTTTAFSGPSDPGKHSSSSRSRQLSTCVTWKASTWASNGWMDADTDADTDTLSLLASSSWECQSGRRRYRIWLEGKGATRAR